MNEAKLFTLNFINSSFNAMEVAIKTIPFATNVVDYASKNFQNDPERLLLEVCLVIFLGWYFFRKAYQPGTVEVDLSEKEIDALIAEWEPEPLCNELTEFDKFELNNSTFTQTVSLKAKSIDGKERLNISAFNFCGLMNSDNIKNAAIEALKTYGVGTCGPPGFYGTLDCHMELERRMAEFVGQQDSILYSQGFSCISSVIPAFAKRGDVLLVDESVNFAIQKGVQLSRSTVKYFKHNDMEDLERLMVIVEEDRLKNRLPITRQFVITEGIFQNSGQICPLPALIELKCKFKYRLIVEESLSLGVLGSRGAGVSDYFKADPSSIDILVAALTNSFAASGGICAGSKEIVEHQRLSGQSYTFSASMPAMLTVTALEALKTIQENPNLIVNLGQNSERMQSRLQKAFREEAIKVDGEIGSPIFHLRMEAPSENREDDERFLQEIVDMVYS